MIVETPLGPARVLRHDPPGTPHGTVVNVSGGVPGENDAKKSIAGCAFGATRTKERAMAFGRVAPCWPLTNTSVVGAAERTSSMVT